MNLVGAIIASLILAFGLPAVFLALAVLIGSKQC